MVSASAVVAEPLLAPRHPLSLGRDFRETRVYNPTVMPRDAPLASTESLHDDAFSRVAAAPSCGTDSGRCSPSTLSTVLDMTPSSMTWVGCGGGSLAGTLSSGVDTASSSGGSAPPPSIAETEDRDLVTMPWGLQPGDDGTDDPDGWAVKSAVDEPINLAFENIKYTVHTRVRLRRGEFQTSRGAGLPCRVAFFVLAGFRARDALPDSLHASILCPRPPLPLAACGSASASARQLGGKASARQRVSQRRVPRRVLPLWPLCALRPHQDFARRGFGPGERTCRPASRPIQ